MEKTTDAFRAPVERLDFIAQPDDARERINGWVSTQTKQRIRNIIGEGGVGPATRLVLVNAIYMLADWANAFEKKETGAQDFTLSNGTTTRAPMMHRTMDVRSGATNGARMVELPYRGNALSMTLIVPDAVDGLAAIEATLGNRTVGEIDKALKTQRTAVALPRFTIDPSAPLALGAALRALGVTSAFDPATADFSAIARPEDPARRLYITDVVHKAFVKVDEKGTEAAAATALSMDPSSAEPMAFDVTAERPFVFLVRDRATGLVRILGRVASPRS